MAEKALMLGVPLVLLMILALNAFDYWQWRQSFDQSIEAAALLVEPPVHGRQLDYDRVGALFGETVVIPEEPKVMKSALALKLKASYVAGQRGRSAAVISSSEVNHKLYYQGEQIMPGVELVAVQARRVLIKRNGALESISLEEVTSDAQRVAPVIATTQPPRPARDSIADASPAESMTEKLNRLRSLARGEN